MERKGLLSNGTYPGVALHAFDRIWYRWNAEFAKTSVEHGRWAAHDGRQVQNCGVPPHYVYSRTCDRDSDTQKKFRSKSLTAEVSAVDSLVRNGWKLESESAVRYTRTIASFHRLFSAFFSFLRCCHPLFVALFSFISFSADKQKTA